VGGVEVSEKTMVIVCDNCDAERPRWWFLSAEAVENMNGWVNDGGLDLCPKCKDLDHETKCYLREAKELGLEPR